MRVGLAIELSGRPGWLIEGWRYEHIRSQARLAEELGFDRIVVEDALSIPGEDHPTVGAWESVVILAGLAEATSTIGIGHSVVNAPYRNPGHLASIALTIDEVSDGRYTLGIGAGNTPDEDYERFGIPADQRYSRFIDTVTIVHDLLRNGRADHEGEHASARGAELVRRGRREGGPPLVIGAGGPRMQRAAARFADEWNWWVTPFADPEDLRPQLTELDRACEEVGRRPSTLRRSLDVYLPVGPIGWDPGRDGDPPATGPEETAELTRAYADLGIEEVRYYLPRRGISPEQRLDDSNALRAVVPLLHDV